MRSKLHVQSSEMLDRKVSAKSKQIVKKETLVMRISR